MPKSIWAAVSGLDNHQSWMDVIGNNIANVNTTGFKDARYEFHDILSQSFRGAAPPTQGGIGGTNAQQVGLGTTTGSINTITLQGSLQQTTLPTDVAIQGEGYFVVGDGLNQHFTRDGNFHIDAAGNIVASNNGLHLMGIATDGAGNLQPARGLQNLSIPQTVNPAEDTTFLDLFGNLDSRATTAVTQTINVVDSLGESHAMVLTFTPTNPGTGVWDVTANSPDFNTTQAAITVGQISFDGLGQLISGGPLQLPFAGGTPWNISGTTTQSLAVQNTITLQLADPAVGNLTSFATSSAVSTQQAPNPPTGTTPANRAGNSAGFLKSFSISPDGTIRGSYSTGFTMVLGQIQLATFVNPAGLQRIGQNDWDVTSNSGQANINNPGAGPAGTVAQGSLETSNVNMATELTAMILAQRGFQANSKMITTTDEMLQDVVAMKR